jgi:hypothetical protein
MDRLIAQGRFLLKVLGELMRLADYDAEAQLQSLHRVPEFADAIYRLAAEAPEVASRTAAVQFPLAVRLAIEGRK